MKILFTAFEPFGQYQSNSSEQVLRLLPDIIGGCAVHKLLLPVSFRRCLDPVAEYLAKEEPSLIVALGQAAKRPDISVESRAVNLANAKMPDNDGLRPHMAAIVEGGPAACETTLPVDDLCAAILAAGAPCHFSHSAGLYVCNTLYYRLLHAYPHIPSIFIHLPAQPPATILAKPIKALITTILF